MCSIGPALFAYGVDAIGARGEQGGLFECAIDESGRRIEVDLRSRMVVLVRCRSDSGRLTFEKEHLSFRTCSASAAQFASGTGRHYLLTILTEFAGVAEDRCCTGRANEVVEVIAVSRKRFNHFWVKT